MRIAVGSDMLARIVDVVIEEVSRRGHEVVLFGAPKEGAEVPWPKVAEELSSEVSKGACDQGILLCWTGTGVTIVSNKVPGVRAALCPDAETARGARRWNDANVLAMSIRLTSEYVVREILDSWFGTEFDLKEKPMIDMVREVEGKYMKKADPMG